MFILQSVYLNLGIHPDWLQWVAVDSNGYIQHPPDAIIGTDGVTTLRELVKLAGANPDTFFEEKANNDYIWQPSEE
jgi:hypothetical protein